MKKIYIIVPIIILPIIIFTLFIGSFVKDKNDSKVAMGIIEKDYQVFENNLLTFNNYRDEIYDKVFSDSYYENFLTNLTIFNNMFKTYETTTKKTSDDAKNLIEYCDGIYYTRSEINTMCSNFSNNYEVMINSFVKDTNNYNTLIGEFNNYIKENNINTNNIDKYKTTIKYIDYNKDKKYDGKE